MVNGMHGISTTIRAFTLHGQIEPRIRFRGKGGGGGVDRLAEGVSIFLFHSIFRKLVTHHAGHFQIGVGEVRFQGCWRRAYFRGIFFEKWKINEQRRQPKSAAFMLVTDLCRPHPVPLLDTIHLYYICRFFFNFKNGSLTRLFL